MEQAKYDMAYQDFLDRQNFASNALGDYAGMLYGFPTEGFKKQTQGYSKPSAFQNLSALFSAGQKFAPFFGFKEGGHIAFRSNGGLSGMYYPEELDQYAPVPEKKATPPAIDKNNFYSSMFLSNEQINNKNNVKDENKRKLLILIGFDYYLNPKK